MMAIENLEVSETLALDAHVLRGPVQAALRCPDFEVHGWDVRAITADMTNPVTAGIYRVSGNGACSDGRRAWSLVLKVVRNPASIGATNMGDDRDPSHWNYWRRESVLYQSGLLSNMPAGLRPVRCYGVEERGSHQIWIWLEEVRDIYRGAWPFATYLQTAEVFGRFNGAYLVSGELPQLGWLGDRLLHQWANGLPSFAPQFFRPASAAIWEHPYVRCRFPAPERQAFVRMVYERARVLDALDRLPQTFCHKDAWPVRNLMVRPDRRGRDQLVAIDWALAGTGPVGEELVQIVRGALANQPSSVDLEIHDSRLFAAYMRGLRAAGWQGDEQQVRLGYTASYVLREGFYQLYLIDRTLHQHHPHAPPASLGRDEQLAARFVMRMAEEALDLLGALT